MSAICGIVRFDGKPVESDELETMVESSPYRGPDGTGYHIHKNAGFAHLAFHVTPESVHEKQPLISEDGRLVLVADVRLDNRDELFRKLELRTNPDRVLSDPELILLCWLKWERACVEHLLGDFVFSIWDSKNKTLFLARDPLGAYCVHYHHTGKQFIFASELTAILDLPFVDPVINEERVLREIEYLPRNHEETFFEKLFYLAPAHCMEITANGRRQWRYWDIDPDFQTRYESDDEYAEHLLDLVHQSTIDRMRCTGTVGISLSGGHDSTLVAANAASHLAEAQSEQSKLKSFSYVFDRLHECDERRFIEPVVEQHGLDAHYVQGDDLWTFRHLEKQTIARDHLWTNCFVNLPLSIAGAARQAGCRVLLDGHYGDALFAGSNLTVADLLSEGQFAHLFSYLNRNASAINWKRDVLLHGLGPLSPNWARKVYRQFRTNRNGINIEGLTAGKKQMAVRIRNNPELLPVPGKMKPGAKRRYRSLMNPAWAQGFAAVRASTYNRFGIEPASPLYSQRIVEFMLSVPDDRVNRPGKPSYLQVNAMKKVLPDVVCDRQQKTSFTDLLKAGVLEKENEVVGKLLHEPLIVQQDWLDKEWLNGELQAGENWSGFGYPLSNCLHLELWLRAIKPVLQKEKRWSVAEPPFY
jgi:asparagine synthase (glutamine-hydrolysing)